MSGGQRNRDHYFLQVLTLRLREKNLIIIRCPRDVVCAGHLLELQQHNESPPSISRQTGANGGQRGTDLLRQESRWAGEASGPGLVTPRARPLTGKFTGGRHQLDQAIGENWCVKGVRVQNGGGRR